MKTLLIMGLAFANVFTFGSFDPKAKEKNKPITIVQVARTLELSLESPKRRYRRNDQFKLRVMLTNTGERDVYLFGSLDWGYSSSLMFHVRDSAGKEIEPLLSPDSQTYASAADTSAFIKLGPDHFIGTTYYAPIKSMNLTRPGKYAVFVEYNSPFSANEVKLSPFWGKENGTLKSNIVWIEVVR